LPIKLILESENFRANQILLFQINLELTHKMNIFIEYLKIYKRVVPSLSTLQICHARNLHFYWFHLLK